MSRTTQFTAIVCTLIFSGFASAGELWKGKVYHFDNENNLIEVKKKLVDVDKINDSQSIYNIITTDSDGKKSETSCLVTSQKSSPGVTDVTSDCENGYGEAQCLGRLCDGLFENDNGNTYEIDAVIDENVRRTYSEKVEGSGPAKKRQILYKVK